MPLTEETLRFIREHREDDVRNLALQAHRYPTVDMPAAVTQIAGWQTAREKIPTWAGQEGIRYPRRLSLEQCSSEVTARYKAAVINRITAGCHCLTDLTGGLGVDCAFLAPLFRQVTYVERQEVLCEMAAHNFPLLGLKHVSICHEDCIGHLKTMPFADWIFIDPARRDGHGGKTVAISDCEPDIAALEEGLLEKAGHVLVKLSPMLDLVQALHDLKHVQEVHIVSVGNECKELLLVLGQNCNRAAGEVPIHCVNLTGTQTVSPFVFTRKEEKESPCNYTATLEAYLYEPHASLLKAGAFRSLSYRYKVKKLHPNSHLYTSDVFIETFPGRRFRIIGCCGFNKKEIKSLLAATSKANLTIRNFPASASDLRKQLKLAEGGDRYLFATTLADERHVLVKAVRWNGKSF